MILTVRQIQGAAIKAVGPVARPMLWPMEAPRMGADALMSSSRSGGSKSGAAGGVDDGSAAGRAVQPGGGRGGGGGGRGPRRALGLVWAATDEGEVPRDRIEAFAIEHGLTLLHVVVGQHQAPAGSTLTEVVRTAKSLGVEVVIVPTVGDLGPTRWEQATARERLDREAAVTIMVIYLAC
jgi:hypothetical protein